MGSRPPTIELETKCRTSRTNASGTVQAVNSNRRDDSPLPSHMNTMWFRKTCDKTHIYVLPNDLQLGVVATGLPEKWLHACISVIWHTTQLSHILTLNETSPTNTHLKPLCVTYETHPACPPSGVSWKSYSNFGIHPELSGNTNWPVWNKFLCTTKQSDRLLLSRCNSSATDLIKSSPWCSSIVLVAAGGSY